MPPAIIAAGVGAVGAIGGGLLANKGASKAAKATTQAADQSAQITSQIYGQNQAALAPWQQSGMQANSLINAALGMGGGRAQPQVQSYYSGANPAGQPMGFEQAQGYNAQNPGQFQRNALLGVDYATPGDVSGYGGGTWNASGGAMAPGNAVTPQQSANSAFDIFRNSTGYQFRLGQGLDAVNGGYAGRGTLQSGAAMRAINDYGQGMASQEFGNWLGSLGNQQALGFSAASAQAGVGQNYANSLANIYQNQGANQANAALLKAQNTGQMFNSLGVLAGNAFGGMR